MGQFGAHRSQVPPPSVSKGEIRTVATFGGAETAARGLRKDQKKAQSSPIHSIYGRGSHARPLQARLFFQRAALIMYPLSLTEIFTTTTEIFTTTTEIFTNMVEIFTDKLSPTKAAFSANLPTDSLTNWVATNSFTK
ncbi:hypothetical protein BJ322DRAFT_1024322 [Thelephora terrestris]|uniref:Uncharacterized protein n=1 Tax=Thelephora terrestris TaxID=56493 RepID=A0A9P6L261_9AGAM|nr:hypothetical protein BJ322DRAFT_1024322 [Thelephora terrestris]